MSQQARTTTKHRLYMWRLLLWIKATRLGFWGYKLNQLILPRFGPRLSNQTPSHRSWTYCPPDPSSQSTLAAVICRILIFGRNLVRAPGDESVVVSSGDPRCTIFAVPDQPLTLFVAMALVTFVCSFVRRSKLTNRRHNPQGHWLRRHRLDRDLPAISSSEHKHVLIVNTSLGTRLLI